MSNVIPLPSANLPARRTIYSRTGASRTVTVVEDELHGQRQYWVVIDLLFKDSRTVIGPLCSQGEALRQARWEVR